VLGGCSQTDAKRFMQIHVYKQCLSNCLKFSMLLNIRPAFCAKQSTSNRTAINGLTRGRPLLLTRHQARNLLGTSGGRRVF